MRIRSTRGTIEVFGVSNQIIETYLDPEDGKVFSNNDVLLRCSKLYPLIKPQCSLWILHHSDLQDRW
jgi:hypothetical protein